MSLSVEKKYMMKSPDDYFPILGLVALLDGTHLKLTKEEREVLIEDKQGMDAINWLSFRVSWMDYGPHTWT